MKTNFILVSEFISDKIPFAIKETVCSTFANDFHFHNECQLVYIESGKGTRIIGNSIEQFEAGDLIFVGPRVPHVWYSMPKLNTDKTSDVSVTLYIDPIKMLEISNLFGDTQPLKLFFQDSIRGIRIVGRKKNEIRTHLKKMVKQKKLVSVSSFFKIFDLLLDAKDLVWLNDSATISEYSIETEGRVARLMNFIQENFREEISLEKAASISNLQLHSFCRFFKKLTHRTFSDFINEMRIKFVCQNLQQSDRSITQIAFEAGYNNISYFNRSFKKILKITPNEFRQKNIVL